jgi:hypothetical protein
VADLDPALISVIAACQTGGPELELLLAHGDAWYIERAVEYLSTRDYLHAAPNTVQ